MMGTGSVSASVGKNTENFISQPETKQEKQISYFRREAVPCDQGFKFVLLF